MMKNTFIMILSLFLINCGKKELHNHIKDQLPNTKKGLIDAYKDIIPTLLRQKEDPSYHLPISLPDNQNI